MLADEVGVWFGEVLINGRRLMRMVVVESWLIDKWYSVIVMVVVVSQGLDDVELVLLARHPMFKLNFGSWAVLTVVPWLRSKSRSKKQARLSSKGREYM